MTAANRELGKIMKKKQKTPDAFNKKSCVLKLKPAGKNLFAALESPVSGNTKDARHLVLYTPYLRGPAPGRVSRLLPRPPWDLPFVGGRRLAAGLGSPLWWANLAWPLASPPRKLSSNPPALSWSSCDSGRTSWRAVRGDYRLLSEGLSEDLY